MTLEEKAAFSLGATHWHTAEVERLGVTAVMLSDGPHGIRAQLPGSGHVGFVSSVPATCFPTSGALASSWNVELMSEVGRAIGREARKWSVGVVLGPGLNMKRSPLCGRNFEYLSEDPWLAGELASALVLGIQELGVGACLKHFAANNQETDRLRVSAEVDERTLREIYLPAFERVVTERQPWMVMCAYNKVNGVYASEHTWLLNDVLRREWGFEGAVVSDWGAVHDRVAALKAGLDLEMPPDHDRTHETVVNAVKGGDLDESVLEATVSRMIDLSRLAAPGMADPLEVDEDQHHDLARRAARESAVLLKNRGSSLPLRLGAGDSVAVIGEFARAPRFQGSGSSRVNATRVDIAYDELRAALPDEVEMTFSPGYGLDSRDVDDQLIREATEAARAASHIVLFAGLPPDDEWEGIDRTHMHLPANQVALIEAVAAVSKSVVVVLVNGASVVVSTWESRVDAILESWLSGQAAGVATADLLLGRANPSGKLAETIPVRLEDIPSTLNFPGEAGHVRYGEGIYIGYRAHDKLEQEVSYPFGFGLSYTTFAVEDVSVVITGSADDGNVRAVISGTLTNTGEVRGAEVVQAYVSDPQCTVSRPVRELKGAVKIELDAGESRRFDLALDQRAFSFWSEIHGCWVVEAGEFLLSVGTSSRDIKSTTSVQLASTPPAARLNAMSTLDEWLADASGRSILEAEYEGRSLPHYLNPAIRNIEGSMPMRTLAKSDRSGLSHAELDRWLVELG